MPRLVSKRLHYILPLAVLVGAFLLRAVEPRLVEQVRLWTFDTFNQVKPRAYDPLAPVRVVDIDEASLARIGQWPWPRVKLAELVERLGEAGAAAIAVDAVFAESDRTSPGALAELWPKTEAFRDLRARLRTLPDHDAVFAGAISRAPVVMGFALSDSGGQTPPALKAGLAVAGDDPAEFLRPIKGAVVNLPALEEAAAGNGTFTANPHRDGVFRRAPTVLRMGDQVYPSLAVEALRVAQGASTIIVKASRASGTYGGSELRAITEVKVGQFVIPTDAEGQSWIHFAGTQSARSLPAWRVFEADFDRTEVEGRIVFVGTSAEGLKDLRATPLNPTTAGVEVHAEFLEQVFSGTSLERPDFALGVEAVYLLVVGLALILLLPRVGARWSGALGGGAIAVVVGASWFAYARHLWLFDPVFPSFTIAAIYVVETGIIFLKSESERRWVKGAFSRYLSPAVVSRLAEHPEKLALGGEMREMTILFSDVRDFTRRAEKLDAHGLTRFINRYLTPMSEIVLVNQGTIDKYIGDAIMAFWNAPLDDKDHAANACRTVLAMRAALARLNESWAAEAATDGVAFESVRIGMGLNTGPCVVGNMGSDQRFDYSVLGDDVNLASRLEGQSKTYGLDNIVSEATRTAAPGFAALEVDLLRVKGRSQPVRIFTLMGEVGLADDPAYAALAGHHGRMLAAYRVQDWAGAGTALAACRAAAWPGLQGLHALYAARLDEYRQDPPDSGWDGVYTAQDK